jgi:hypothetical protein
MSWLFLRSPPAEAIALGFEAAVPLYAASAVIEMVHSFIILPFICFYLFRSQQ